MSDTKVKELPEAQSVGANDLLYLVANDTDYKVKGSTVKSFVKPAVMSGATSIAPGSEGLVPAPSVGDNTKYFSGDGTYKQPALSEMSDDATHRLVTDTEKATWNGKADPSDIPTSLSQLTDDSTHRVVTDAEKTTWSNKQDALEFDDEPTDGSNNPVKSNGIYDALTTKANSADLATVATTGDYDDLTNAPTIPVIEANPSGEATAEMQKLKIDSTIYKFASQKAYGEITDVDIASFSDGADNEPLAKLEVGVEAVQDLHGYDAPWPAGGGKNKLPPSSETTDISDNGVTLKRNANGTYSLSGTATADASLTWSIAKTVGTTSGQKICLMNSVLNENISFSFRKSNDASVIGLSFNAQNRVYTTTADYNDIAKIRITIPNGTNVNGVTFSPMIVDGSADTTTFAPYSNICPISGWDEVKVNRTRKNLANIKPYSDWEIIANTYLILKDTLPENKRLIMSFKDKDTSVDMSGIYFGFLSNDFTPNIQTSQYRWCIENGTMKSITTNVPNNGDSSIYLNSLAIYPRTEAAYNRLFARYDIQVEIGNSATTYEPYHGQTYTIDLGGTRYGGTLDVSTGELVVTHKLLTMSDVTWLYSDSLGLFYATLSDYKKTSTTVKPNAQCELFNVVGRNKVLTDRENGLTFGNVGEYDNRILIRESSIADLSTFESIINGKKLVYELATPLTIQLTPTQVKSLLGNNNIWADSGQIKKLVYVRDLNTYLKSLDDRITALENA